MEFKTKLERFEDNPLWGYHFVIPDEVVKPFLNMAEKRVQCAINSGKPFHCALMPRGDGKYFINLNKERRKQLKLQVGDELEAQIRPDNSEYGLPVPEELQELFIQDEQGKAFFHALTPGKQRALLFIAGKPKTSATRLRKAITIVEYLKSTGGRLDFKELNEAMKNKTFIDF